MPHCRYYPIALILLLYLAIQTICFQEAGIVGEVAIGWSSQPNVIINTHPITLDDGHEWGVLLARETRPRESLVLWGLSIPLAINSYTSAIPDWPSALIYSVFRSVEGVQYFHILCGAGLLLLCIYLFPDKIGLLMATLLACDWTFLIYKQLLGGTELCLQLASIGLLWSLYRKQSWGTALFCIFLGLQAKITFAFLVIPCLLTIVLFPIPMKRTHIKKGIMFGSLLLLPILITNIHHLQIENTIQSHDTIDMQWQRIVHVFSEQSQNAIREQHENIWLWALHPLSFYERIYDLPQTLHWVFGIRMLGWILVFGLWIRSFYTQNKSLAFLFCSSLLFIGLGPKDMHHFSMMVPIWAFWLGNTVHNITHPLAWISPFVCSGIILCGYTDTVFSQIPIPSFSKTKQEQLISILDHHNVHKLVTMDYELYGLFETQHTKRDIYHGWGAISRRRYHTLPHLIEQAQNGHILLVTASMPMRYNLNPTNEQLHEAAQKKHLRIQTVEETSELRLFHVSSAE